MKPSAVVLLVMLAICNLTISPPAVAVDDTAAYDPAAVALASRWGVSLDEAQQRIDAQATFTQAAAAMNDAYPEAFAGAYIDQADGGTVHFESTRWTSDMLAALRGLVPDGSRYVTDVVQHSLNGLAAIAKKARAALPARDGVVTGPDLWKNTVDVVTFRNVAGSQKALAATLAPALGADFGKSVTATTMDKPTLPASAYELACSNPSPTVLLTCDSPTRDGDVISHGNQICSIGFKTADANGLPYALTAGHCLKDAGPNGTAWSYLSASTGNWNAFGTQHLTGIQTTSQDAGIISVPNAGVFGTDRVFVAASSGPGYPTTRNENYAISTTPGTSGPLVGSYVCKSGATGGTACGYLNAVNYTNPTTGSTGLAQVIMDQQQGGVYTGVACGGDSGGAVYVGGVGYGIVDEGVTQANYTRNGNTCFGVWAYRGLSAALTDLHVHLVGS